MIIDEISFGDITIKAKRKPLETGPKHEFHTGFINAYPKLKDGYNKFFDVSLKGCDVLLGRAIEKVDLEKISVLLDGNEKMNADLIISTNLLIVSSFLDIVEHLEFHLQSQ